MPINFPTSLDTTTQLPTEAANVVLATNHVISHTNLALAIIALETKVGVTSSAVNTTFDYKLSGVATGDKSASLTGVEALTNKTLTSPKVNVGSDATADTYYRNSGGVFTRLAIGSTNQVLTVIAGLPSWQTPTAIVNASYAALGIVQFLTDAATSGITVSSGVANVNYGTGNNQIVKLDGSAKLPAVDGSALTNVTIYGNGTTTYNIATASGIQTIAHGLGKTPKRVRIKATFAAASIAAGGAQFVSETIYNGTTQSSVSAYGTNTNAFSIGTSFILGTNVSGSSSDTATGVVTVDGTNITITWTKSGSATGTYTLLWEAQA